MGIDHTALTLEAWDRSTDTNRSAIAAAVADAVGGTVVEIEVDAQGDQRHSIVVIDVRDVRMALVPGGAVALGWDSTSPLGLTGAQRAALAADPDASQPFDELLAYYLTPARTVTLAPFLVEIDPTSVADWVGDGDGDLLAAVEARARSDGFRLPTDDEWEHAVRGGSMTLFRWGDQWPDGTPMPRESHFTGHLVPSAFGVHLLHDPYQVEVVSSPLGFRGGDGGSFVCGCAPVPQAWMTFASAFRWPRPLWDDVVVESLQQAWARRVLAID